MHSYRLKRDDRNWATSRQAYLEDCSNLRVGEPAFCHAIEFALHSKSAAKSLEAEMVNSWDDKAAWANFPWVTPMLGSGCLELRDQYEFTADSVAAGVERRLLDLLGEQSPPRGEHPATLARTFTKNLVGARLPQDDDPKPDGDAVTVEPLAARVTLLAARLTALYHWVNAAGLTSMSRWDDDVARLDPDRSKRPRELQDIDELLVDPLQRERVAAVQEIHRASTVNADGQADPIYKAVATLLAAIGDNLVPRDELDRDMLISRGHVRVLTEIAWFLLVRHSTVYPGWTESLLRLTLEQKSEKLRPQRRMSPVLANLLGTHETVRIFMEPATEASWERLQAPDEQPSARNRLYQTCASLLYSQQQAAVQWQLAGSDGRAVVDKRLPTPSAYVTSFDLELEMAMWLEGCRRDGASSNGAPNDGPTNDVTFSVVVPVHVLKGSGRDAQFCWLRADLTPESSTTDLDVLRRPQRWRVARDEDELPEQPVIVHLNGAPLFHLPEFVDKVEGLAEDLERIGVLSPVHERGHGRYKIVHAVTVDEYLARRQSERELTWLSMGSEGNHRFVRRALPSNLQRDNLSRRFWMVLGVPIADPAVRTRVMAHLIPRPGTNRPGRPAGNPSPTADPGPGVGPVGSLFADDDQPEQAPVDPPEQTKVQVSAPWDAASEAAQEGSEREDAPAATMGVAVNRRIDNDEASLLYWLGIDVVRTDVHDFVVDLEHYVEHLLDEGAPAPVAYEEACTVSLKGSR